MFTEIRVKLVLGCCRATKFEMRQFLKMVVSQNKGTPI